MDVTEIKETPHINRDPGPCFLGLRLRSGDPRAMYTDRVGPAGWMHAHTHAGKHAHIHAEKHTAHTQAT